MLEKNSSEWVSPPSISKSFKLFNVILFSEMVYSLYLDIILDETSFEKYF